MRFLSNDRSLDFDEKNTNEHMSGGGAVFKNLKKNSIISFIDDT